MTLPLDKVDAKSQSLINDSLIQQHVSLDDKDGIVRYQAQKLNLRFELKAGLSDSEAELRGILKPSEDGLSSLHRYQKNIIVLDSTPRYEHFLVEILSRNFSRMAEC